MINYFWDLFDRCNKWKRLYLEEHKKYKDLKKWTEELIKSNNDLLENFKKLKLK